MQRRRIVLGVPAALAAGLCSARGAHAEATVVRFGQSASLTGGQAGYGRDVRDGIAAAFASASIADASKGLRYELLSLDDGGDKERCRTHTKSLIASGVTGLLGFTSGAAAEAAAPLIEEARIATLGAASGNMGIRDQKLAMQFHVRAGYDSEFHHMVSYVKDFGMRRVGYVYLSDTSTANSAAMSTALSKVGVKLTEAIGLDRNAKSFEAEAGRLLAANLDCIMFTANAAPISAIVDRLKDGRYPGLYFSSSFAGQPLIDAMSKKSQSIIMTQVVPRPNAVALAVVNRCRQDLVALGTGTRMGFTAMEGYIAGLVAVEAVRSAGVKNGTLQRSRFRDALAGLRTDLGGYKIDFAAGRASGSRFVDVVALDRSGRIIG